MTVTWPLPPGSTLADPARPIVFTTERDVPAVSVSFGPRRTEERAYRDGGFLWPYLRSQRSGNTFTLVRDDGQPGWPADPKPFVDEEPAPTPPPSGGQPWGAIYDIDLSSLPNQTLNATGQYTIAGLKWWRKNALVTGSSFQIVNGSGLSAVGGDGSGGVTAPRLCLPVANIPGFNNAAPYQVWFHSEGLANKPLSMGIIDAPADATAITAAHDPGHFSAGPNNATTTNNWWMMRAGANSNFTGPQVSSNFSNSEHALYVATDKFDILLLGNAYSGASLPAGNAFTYSGYQTYGRGSARTSPLIIITPSYQTVSVLKRITVLQPKVPA